MRNSKAFLKYWLPVLLWMVLIFLASSDANSYEHSSSLLEPLLRWLAPHLAQARIEVIHHIMRKCAHLTEYAVLALLLWRAIHNTRGEELPQLAVARRLLSIQGLWKWEDAGLALSIVFFYAATDEFHQIFVPTRTPALSDVGIDTCGGAAALIVLWIFMRWQKN